MSETPQTVFVTKYALTDGIQTWTGTPDASGRVYAKRGRVAFGMTLTPSEFALTRGEAVAQAEDRRRRKTASLEKQIAKLRKMTFDVRAD